jgi:membrane protease YdiL (CAAX protease family)
MKPYPKPPQHFILVAAIFEGALAVVAVGLGWLLGQPPLETLTLDYQGFGLGVAVAGPPLLLFWLSVKFPLRPFADITRFLDKTIIPWFRSCSWIDLLGIATLAGLGEEMLFRGIIQAAVAKEIGDPYGVWIGLVMASMLFGLLHAMTPMYATLAGLISLYFGWVWLASGNLLVPITAHAVYDFAALIYFVKIRRSFLSFEEDAAGHEGSPHG